MVFEGTAIEIMTFRLLMAIASSAMHVVSLSRDFSAGSANRSLREYRPRSANRSLREYSPRCASAAVLLK